MPAADQANASQADPPGLTVSVSVSASQHLIIEVLRRPVEFTVYTPVDIRDVQDLSAELPLWRRIQNAVKSGPLTLAALADDLSAKVDSVEKAVKRRSTIFTKVDGADGVQRVALLARDDE